MIARRNTNNLRYADDTTLMAESEEELKSLLMKMKEESEKVSLKLNIQKTKIMASGPITSWQIDGEIVETMTDFILGGSKITADSDYSHEIKRRLLLGRKVMTNLDSILKSRDITLSTKVHLVAMAPHSSTLAWKIPQTEEPGRLQSMGSRRVGHNWATILSLFTFMHWRRKWQPTPVFLPGESQNGGAWWATVYGVAQSRTRLKQLSSSSQGYGFSSSHVWIWELDYKESWAPKNWCFWTVVSEKTL